MPRHRRAARQQQFGHCQLATTDGMMQRRSGQEVLRRVLRVHQLRAGVQQCSDARHVAQEGGGVDVYDRALGQEVGGEIVVPAPFGEAVGRNHHQRRAGASVGEVKHLVAAGGVDIGASLHQQLDDRPASPPRGFPQQGAAGN